MFFFFNDTATTEIYTLSLHDALPISWCSSSACPGGRDRSAGRSLHTRQDRKSTRLNSSHSQISYAVFCLKKKKQLSIRHQRLHLTLIRIVHDDPYGKFRSQPRFALFR